MSYVDSNVFIYPVIYDPSSVPEAARAKRLLLEVAPGKVEAYTHHLGRGRVGYRKILGVEASVS